MYAEAPSLGRRRGSSAAAEKEGERRRAECGVFGPGGGPGCWLGGGPETPEAEEAEERGA